MSIARSVGTGIASIIKIATLPLGLGRVRNKTLAQISDSLVPIVDVRTPLGELRFRCPNAESVRVPSRHLTWEPETIRWIEKFVHEDDCVWDIGAHIGAFALYAGLRVRNGCGRVIAFEPSSSNYAVLNANIMLSELADSVKAYCLALSDQTGVVNFHLWSAQAGGSLNSCGDARNFHGDFVPEFSQAMATFSADDAISILQIPPPDHIKLDVDSTEQAILSGARVVLKTVKSVLVEIERERPQPWKDAVYRIFDDAGLIETDNPGVSVGRNVLFTRRAR